MNNVDKQYLELCDKILKEGNDRPDRTGTGTKSIFGHTMRFNLQEGFPLLTTKRVYFTGVVDELLFFIKGSESIEDLPERSRQIWEPWAGTNGALGPMYGTQLRNWNYQLDQLQRLITELKQDPYSRRHVITLWNPGTRDLGALALCHGTAIQFYVENNKLSCLMFQRSADTFIGLPFNIASYAVLTHMVAQQTNLDVGDLIIQLGDAHIYNNHIDQIKEQLTRTPRELPKLKLNYKDHIDNYTVNDVQLEGYNPHPTIKGKVSI